MFCLFPMHDRKHVNIVNRSKNILSPCGYNLKDWDRHRIQRVREERDKKERERGGGSKTGQEKAIQSKKIRWKESGKE